MVVAAALLWGGVADAVVPPRDCGRITVKSKRYNIKTDQLTCEKARRYARRYLETSARPSGYKCTRYQDSSLAFRCINTRANPDRTFFAIKR